MTMTLSGTSGLTFPNASTQAAAPPNNATDSGAISTAVTLTATSAQYQIVRINSSANSVVNLPDATTLANKGSSLFIISNQSPISDSLAIKDASGNFVSFISAGATAVISLVSNSTTAGVWAAYSIPSTDYQDFFVNYNTSSVTTTTVASPTFASTNLYFAHGLTTLSATTFLRWFYTVNVNNGGGAATTGYWNFSVGTVSGSSITFGTMQQFAVSGPGFYETIATNATIEVMRLSDTSFVIRRSTMSPSNGNSEGASTIGIIGFATGTVTAGTVALGAFGQGSIPSGYGVNFNQLNAIGNSGIMCRLTDTSYAIFYTDAYNGTYSYPYNYSGLLACQIVSVSGTTQTFGTKVTLASSNYAFPISATVLDSSRIFLCYAKPASAGANTGRTYMMVVSYSGTVPTFNTAVAIEGADTTIVGGAFFPYIGQSWNGFYFWDQPRSRLAVAGDANTIYFNTGYSICKATTSGTTPTFVSTLRANDNGYLFQLTSTVLLMDKRLTNLSSYLTIDVSSGANSGGMVATINNTNATLYSFSTSMYPWGPLSSGTATQTFISENEVGASAQSAYKNTFALATVDA